LREIDLAERQDTGRHIDVADIGKTLDSEQFLGDVLGSQTDPRDLCQSHGRRFGGFLCRLQWWRAEKASSTG